MQGLHQVVEVEVVHRPCGMRFSSHPVKGLCVDGLERMFAQVVQKQSELLLRRLQHPSARHYVSVWSCLSLVQTCLIGQLHAINVPPKAPDFQHGQSAIQQTTLPLSPSSGAMFQDGERELAS